MTNFEQKIKLQHFTIFCSEYKIIAFDYILVINLEHDIFWSKSTTAIIFNCICIKDGGSCKDIFTEKTGMMNREGVIEPSGARNQMFNKAERY